MKFVKNDNVDKSIVEELETFNTPQLEQLIANAVPAYVDAGLDILRRRRKAEGLPWNRRKELARITQTSEGYLSYQKQAAATGRSVAEIIRAQTPSRKTREHIAIKRFMDSALGLEAFGWRPEGLHRVLNDMAEKQMFGDF